MNLLALTGLHPDPKRPLHGLFIRRWLAALADRTGWTIRVVAPRPVPAGWLGRLLRPSLAPSLLPAEGENPGFPEVRYPRYPHLPGLGVPRQADRVAEAVYPTVEAWDRERRFDAVLGLYLYPYGVAAARVAERLERPLVLSARGSDVNILARHRRLRAQVGAALRQAVKVHAVSADLGAALAALAGPGAPSVAVVGNGVETDVFRPGAGDGRGGYILSVGRLAPEKRHAALVRALPHLPGGPELWIAGDGPCRAPLEKLARRHGVGGRVRLLGGRPPKALADLYRQAAVFALPSSREGCPNALLEALASGTPAVATPVGAVPELLADPGLGQVVDDPDPRRLAAALSGMISRGRKPEATDRFRATWNWPRVADRLAAVLRGVLP